MAPQGRPISPLLCTATAFDVCLAPRLERAPARLSLLAGWAGRGNLPLFGAANGLAALEPRLGTLITDEWPATQDESLLDEVSQLLGSPPRKIIAPPAEAQRIAAATTQRFEVQPVEWIRQGCYRLDRLLRYRGHGHLRRASFNDIPLLQNWDEAMALEAKLGQTEAAAMRGLTRHNVQLGRRRLWDNDGPRCTLGFAPISNAFRIVLVYTPPVHRGRHYASAAVSAMCAELLDMQGADTIISLYADLDNPASNRVYRGIGFILEGEQLSIELARCEPHTASRSAIPPHPELPSE